MIKAVFSGDNFNLPWVLLLRDRLPQRLFTDAHDIAKTIIQW